MEQEEEVMDRIELMRFADVVSEYEFYAAQGYEISDWCWHTWANWRTNSVVWC